MRFRGESLRAFCLIREQPYYRRDAFTAGLRAAGHEVHLRQPDRYDRNTLLVIWNRYQLMHDLALRTEEAGGRVLVAENGYVGQDGGHPKFQVHPHGPKPNDYYALAEGWHNGGRVPEGDGSRWAAVGVPLKPWRADGDHILICPNRSFGVPGRMMHPDWDVRTMHQISKYTKRPIKIRKHPGNNEPKRPLEADLEGAWACVVWSSSAGVHSLINGIPTFCDAPFWVIKGAGAGGHIDAPVLPEREPFFARLGWSQWTCTEIESGEPFRRLLGDR